jgi:hypothetical protein
VPSLKRVFKLELPHHSNNVVQVVNVAKLRISIIVIVVYLSKQLIHVEEGRHVHVIITAKLKWQPHTSDFLTEGAFTYITDNNNSHSNGDEPVHIFALTPNNVHHHTPALTDRPTLTNPSPQ